MDNYGESTSVTKRCATLQNCLSTGCAAISDSGHQVGITPQVNILGGIYKTTLMQYLFTDY